VVGEILDRMRDEPGELAVGTLDILDRVDSCYAEAACTWWCETMHGWRKSLEK
jgi:hypothetical protein